MLIPIINDSIGTLLFIYYYDNYFNFYAENLLELLKWDNPNDQNGGK